MYYMLGFAPSHLISVILKLSQLKLLDFIINVVDDYIVINRMCLHLGISK